MRYDRTVAGLVGLRVDVALDVNGAPPFRGAAIVEVDERRIGFDYTHSVRSATARYWLPWSEVQSVTPA